MLGCTDERTCITALQDSLARILSGIERQQGGVSVGPYEAPLQLLAKSAVAVPDAGPGVAKQMEAYQLLVRSRPKYDAAHGAARAQVKIFVFTGDFVLKMARDNWVADLAIAERYKDHLFLPWAPDHPIIARLAGSDTVREERRLQLGVLVSRSATPASHLQH